MRRRLDRVEADDNREAFGLVDVCDAEESVLKLDNATMLKAKQTAETALSNRTAKLLADHNIAERLLEEWYMHLRRAQVENWYVAWDMIVRLLNNRPPSWLAWPVVIHQLENEFRARGFNVRQDTDKSMLISLKDT